MEKINSTIQINSSRQHVWDTMLGKETYPIWAKEFSPDNEVPLIEGDWSQGSRMRFMGKDEAGNLTGIAGVVKDNRPAEFLEMEYDSEIVNGQDVPSPTWKGARENYTFTEQDGVTTLTINVDTLPDFKDYMSNAWVKALAKLKELSEK